MRLPPSLSPPPLPPLPLRALLTWPYVVLLLLLAGILSTVAYRAGLKSVESMSDQLLADMALRVEQAVSAHLQDVEIILASAVPRLVKSKPLATPAVTTQPNSSSTDKAAVTPPPVGVLLPYQEPLFARFIGESNVINTLWQLSQLTPSAPYIYFGNQRGDFYGVDRGEPNTPEGHVRLVVRTPGQAFRHIYYANEPMQRTRLESIETQVYEPRARPWYQQASGASQDAWSPIYLSPSTNQLKLTLTQAVWRNNAQGNAELEGVLGAGITLGALSHFMRTLALPMHGVAYIIDEAGDLVASSTSDPPYTRKNGQITRLAAKESRFAHVRESFTKLATLAPSSKDLLQRVRAFNYASGSEDMHMASLALTTRHGLKWSIIVVAPRSDFTAAIHASVFWSIAIALLCFICIMALGVLGLRLVQHDVNHLLNSAQLLVKQGWHSLPRFHTREAQQIGRAMYDSAQALQKNQSTLQHYAGELAAKNATLGQLHQQQTAQLGATHSAHLAQYAERSAVETELLKLQAAFATSPQATCLTDAQGIVEYVNAAWCTHWQRERFDWIGKPCGILNKETVLVELFHVSQPPNQGAASWDSASAQTMECNVEFDAISPKASLANPMHVKIMPIFSAQGLPLACLMVLL